MSGEIEFTPKEALQRLIEHREIFHEEMTSLMRQIMRGDVSPVMIAGILIGLRVKKETIGEITAAAEVMRELATPVPVADPANLLDIVGTGGDGAHTFNISTTVMFVAAAAGAKVAKHGGRSVSSQSGSADALEALGARLDLNADQVAQSIAQTGIGFMFAPNHHSAMKHAAPALSNTISCEGPGSLASTAFIRAMDSAGFATCKALIGAGAIPKSSGLI